MNDVIVGMWLGCLITSVVWMVVFIAREEHYRSELGKLKESEKTIRKGWDDLAEEFRVAWKKRHPEDFR